MSVLQSEIVQRIRFNLGDLPWETTGSASSSSSVVAVTDGTDWAEGDIGEFVNNGENFFVTSVASNNLTAVRGYYGSTAATQASGRVLKNPRYRYPEIVNAISSTIQGFLPYPRVYKVTQTTVSPGWGSSWGGMPWGGGGLSDTGPWYDLASDALGLVSVYQLSDSTPAKLRTFGGFHQRARVILKRDLPTALCASGVGVAFPDGFLDTDNTVTVNYAARITDTISTLSYTDFSDGQALTEAVIFGTVALLQGVLELRRAKRSPGDSDNLRPASYFNQVYHSALNQAEKELKAQHPLMRATGKGV